MFAIFKRNVARIIATATLFFLPSWVMAADEGAAPEWVLSYALILLFVGLSIVILVRSAKRKDSAFSQDELDKMREEELKKLH